MVRQQLFTIPDHLRISKQKSPIPIVTPKITSHITRVNSISRSSKIIFPHRVIKELGLKWNNDYIEWRITKIGGQKVATVRKYSGRST